MNPEKLIPSALATPVRRPMVANCPKVEKRNGRFALPSIAALRDANDRLGRFPGSNRQIFMTAPTALDHITAPEPARL